jgi:F-type H+-transporting ATPase subunit b
MLPVLALALAGLSASPVLAQDDSGKVHLFQPAIELGIWTIVVFLVLLLVLRKYAWGPMLQGLQKREDNIHSAIDEAHRAREEAQKLQKQWQGELDKVHDKVRDITEEAHRNGQRIMDEMTAKARADIAGERDRSRREIDMAKDQALQQLWNQAAQLATVISAKAIRRQISADDHRRLVDEAVAELHNAGQERERQVASIKA